MFLEPTPTQFDLRFRLFGIPVRVHPLFWLVSAIIGWGYREAGVGILAMWIGVVFVSILVHEMGHAMTTIWFGRPSHVVLYSFGGLAISDFALPRRWQRILVSLAGPGAGFVLCGLTVLFWNFLIHFDPEGLPIWSLILVDMLIFVNLYWGLVNLLPVMPLDGGQVCREVCMGLNRAKGMRISLGISFLVAGLIAVYSILHLYNNAFWYPSQNPAFIAFFFGLLAAQSYLMLVSVERDRWRQPYDDNRSW